MSHRPLVFVTGLTLGDFLLWKWSLDGNHEVVALLAGLTLPPLALFALWRAALALASLIAGSALRSRRARVATAATRTARRGKARRATRTARGAGSRATGTATTSPPSAAGHASATAGARPESSGKIAA